MRKLNADAVVEAIIRRSPVELVPAYPMLSIALALNIARRLTLSGKKVAIVAPSKTIENITEGAYVRLIKGFKFIECSRVANEHTVKTVILLWCQLHELSSLDVVFAAGVRAEGSSIAFRKLYARKLSNNIFRLRMMGREGFTYYVKIEEGYNLTLTEPPCSPEVIDALCEGEKVGKLRLRDAVEIIAAHLGVKKAEARVLLARLLEAGCVKMRGPFIDVEC